jgi:xanthine dehydrogenase YagS FAD-binding subunit
VELLQPSSVEELDGGILVHGGTEVVPLVRDGLLAAERLVDVRGVVPRGIHDGVIGAGTTLAELEVEPAIPEALREACRLAASPQLRNMGSLGGNLLQATRCWYWRLGYECRLHGGDRCHAQEGEHREHAIFANGFCASAHPSDVAAALVALGSRVRTNRRELAVEELYRLPDEAMDRKRWSFPQVGVAAARHPEGSTRIALAGVAPIPWRIDGSDDLEAATPLRRTEWKVPLARALVRRALASLD